MPSTGQKGLHTIRFSHRQVMVIVGIGTAVRVLYGCIAHPWLGAPDQLAWQLELDQALSSPGIHYAQLTHAAHEGASFFISLVALLFRPLDGIAPSLSLAALVIDAGSRMIQIKTAQQLFGNDTARWFALWTLLSVPMLIPWGMVNFGLHSLLSFLPFLFCRLVQVFRYARRLPVVCGLFCAMAVSLSYNSMVLVVASLLFLAREGKVPADTLKYLLRFSLYFLWGILPHLFTRFYLYTPENGLAGLSVRGFDGQLPGIENFLHLFTLWFTTLPRAFLLQRGFVSTACVFCFLLAGVVMFFSRKRSRRSVEWLPVSIVLIFMIAYAVSPFYAGKTGVTHYVYYRHLAYILPLLVLLMIDGFTKARKGRVFLLAGWLLLCGTASVGYMVSAKQATPAYAAAGWILAQKYPAAELPAMQRHAPAFYSNEIIRGFGWGLAARRLRTGNREGVNLLLADLQKLPTSYQLPIATGIRHAFDEGVTPVLDPAWRAAVDSALPYIPKTPY